MIAHLNDSQAIRKFGYALGLFLYQVHWYRPIRVVVSWGDKQLAKSLSPGLSFYGVDAYHVGQLPQTVMPAMLSELRADYGVVFAALPESEGKTGIHILADAGDRVPDKTERAITDLMATLPEPAPQPPIDRTQFYSTCRQGLEGQTR